MPAGQLNSTNTAGSVNVVGSSTDLYGTSQGAQLVAQSLPEYSVLTAQGNVYVAGTATAVAPVIAIPTTASQLTLWNGESQTSGTGKSYIILAISWTTIASAAAAFVGQLLVNMSSVATAVPTGTAATAISGLSGLATGSSATILSAVTITNNGVWHPYGPSVNAGAATATISLGSGDVYSKGEYILRPGMRFNMAVLCSAAGSATCDIFVKWCEIPYTLGR